MQQIKELLTTSIPFHLCWILIIALLYIVIHHYRGHRVTSILDVYLNYIPVLTHEFGHIVFNKVSGGHARDLVIVASPTERLETSKQGFAVTETSGRFNSIVTAFGGYIMPPIMLYIGVASLHSQYPSIFIVAYIVIFLYFVLITSRKLLPLLILIGLIALLYMIYNGGYETMINPILIGLYHYILGVLLGEVLQSSWTISKLNFSKDAPDWDGSDLKALTFLPTTLYSCLWVGANIYAIIRLAKVYLMM
ncbi:TPA: M50 family metallopeptidase [Staphylococcus aureus]|nr:M50 family metallopeptidase [Staphylococcus aureus]